MAWGRRFVSSKKFASEQVRIEERICIGGGSVLGKGLYKGKGPYRRTGLYQGIALAMPKAPLPESAFRRCGGGSSSNLEFADEYGYSQIDSTRKRFTGFAWMYSQIPAYAWRSVTLTSEKPLLPNRGMETQFSTRSKSEAAFDELDSFLNRHAGADRDQQMKMIWHNDKFVEKIFALLPIRI
jgi:hypothetical protein